MRNITKRVMAITCAAGMMGISAIEAPVFAEEAEYTLQYQNDDMSEILEQVFSKKLGDMQLKKTENKKEGQSQQLQTVSTYESKKYRVEVVGLDINQSGDQEVTMYLTSKNSKGSDSSNNVVLSNAALQENNESSIVAADTGITIKHETVVNVEDKPAQETVEGEQTQSQQSTSNEAASSDKSSAIAAAALAQVGVGQDCTMLVSNSLAAAGISFHGWPEEYLSLGAMTDQPVPGDIIVYSGHVAVYIGDGQAVHGGWLGSQTVVSSVECTNPLIGFVHIA